MAGMTPDQARARLETMSNADLRHWMAGRRAGADREASLAEAERPSPSLAFDRALELIDLVAELQGWPLPEDPDSQKEDCLAYQRWSRLRRRYARP